VLPGTTRPLTSSVGVGPALQATTLQLAKGALQAGALYTAMPRLVALTSVVWKRMLPLAGTTALYQMSRPKYAPQPGLGTRPVSVLPHTAVPGW
jgi:hypothetical protein